MNYSTQDSIYIENKDIILSVIHSYIGEDELANNYINNYLSSHSVDPRAYQLKGDYHLKAKDYLSALFSYRKSDQIDNSNIYSLYKQSICLYELGKYDEVISILRKVIHLDSYHYNAYYIRGLSYSSTKNYRNAIRDFTDHILINPDNEDTYYYLGICYFNIKQYHRAKESLERYLKINRENPEAHYYLGMIYENILDTDNAISHYSSSRKINNKLSEPNLRLGMLHYRQQNYNKAFPDAFIIELSQSTPLPINLNYATPNTLGVDRIALAVGANSLFPNNNVLAIDTGTCVTFDFVGEDEGYLGGAISPGLSMRLLSLHNETKMLPFIETPNPITTIELIGKDTKSSILSGVINGLENEIVGTINNYSLKYNNLIVLFTGGDSTYFKNRSTILLDSKKNKIFADPYLTLKGLNVILDYNENR